MTEKLQLCFHGVNICDSVLSCYSARLIEKNCKVDLGRKWNLRYAALICIPPKLTRNAQNVVFLLYENKINFAKRGKKRGRYFQVNKSSFYIPALYRIIFVRIRETFSFSLFLSSRYKKVLLCEMPGKKYRKELKFNDIFYITLFSAKHSFLLHVLFESCRCNIINLRICLIRTYYTSTRNVIKFHKIITNIPNIIRYEK